MSENVSRNPSITIDPEFKNLIPPLTSEEYAGLEESILQEGCRDALIVWGDTLIDGHNRFEICTRHNIPFEITEMFFPSRDDVKLWMLKNQLSRRNLSDMQRIAMVRKCEDAVKAKAKERQESTQFGGAGNISLTAGQARDELGAMAGVSGKTYEHAVTVLETAPAPIVEAAMQDALSIHAAYQVTKMEPEQQEEIAQRIEQGEAPKEVVSEVRNRPHVANNSGNNEWYTPADYIEAAREVMGSIDIDPASNDIAQETVKAAVYYTAETNGLDKEWRGNVWMNPPYASDLIGKFIDKLVGELPNIEQAIVLVNNATETEWFGKLISRANAVCFPRSRVKFYMPDGKTGAPLQGQAVIYFGAHKERFAEVFSGKGWCAIPV